MSRERQLELHLPAPPVTSEAPLIPARMVNEFVYCPRLAYLMWAQGEWSETGDTVEGRRTHARIDKLGSVGGKRASPPLSARRSQTPFPVFARFAWLKMKPAIKTSAA